MKKVKKKSETGVKTWQNSEKIRKTEKLMWKKPQTCGKKWQIIEEKTQTSEKRDKK